MHKKPAGKARPESQDSALSSLARLGVDSGGTLTERTNDSDFALETGLKRMSCLYSLGLHDDDRGESRNKSVTVRLRRKDLHAAHPAAYALRTSAMKRESLFRAAYFNPRLFDTGRVRAAVLRSRPASRRTWEAQIGITFDVGRSQGAEREVELGAVVIQGSSVVHRVARTIKVGPADDDSARHAAMTFLEPVTLGPGKYVVSAVVSDPVDPMPQSVQVEIELPEVPRSGPFIVGPVVGRRGARGQVIHGQGNEQRDVLGEEGGFEPLVAPRLDALTDLVVITHVCDAQPDDGVNSRAVARTLRSASGVDIGQLAPVRVDLDESKPIGCSSLVDLVPAAALRHGRDYTFEACIVEAEAPCGMARFAVAPEGAD